MYKGSDDDLRSQAQLQPLNEYATSGQSALSVGDSNLPGGEVGNVGYTVSAIEGDTSGLLIEDTSLRLGLLKTSGTLFSDSDAGAASFRKATITGDYGMLNMGVNGKWSYFAANSNGAIQSLGEGQTLTDTFTVESADGITQTVTITITGVNDAAVITGDVSGSVIEDAATSLIAMGKLSVSDPDADESVFQAGSIDGDLGTLTIDAEGNWTYAADNSQSAIQSLEAGETLSEAFTVKSADGTEQTITITINGVKEAPDTPDAVIAGDVSGFVTEDAATSLTATGKLSVSDPDADESVFQAGSIDGDLGTLTIDAEGNWTYAADNGQSAIQSLGEGETLTDTITVKSADGTEQTVTITVTGVNDAAVITGGVSGSVTEDVDATNDVLMITGTLAVKDVDSGEYFQVGDFDGDYGILQISEAGEWVYAADNSQSAIQSLDEGETLTDTFVVKSADGTEQTISITINGVNEVPVNDTPVIDTNAELSVDGTVAQSLAGFLSATDADNSAADLQYSIVSGPAYGELLLNGVAITDYTKVAFTQDDIDKGLVTFKFVPTAGATAQVLTDDSFSFTVSDGDKTTDSQTFRIHNTVAQVWGTNGADDMTGLANYDDPDATFHVYGFDGDDTLRGGVNADTLDGGGGVDTADYSASDAAVNIDLRRTGAQSGGDAQGDILIGIESIIGSGQDDTIIGSNGADVLYGMDGNDYVWAAYGNDTLDGGAGNDTVTGGRHNNLLLGGDGNHALGDTLAGIENLTGSNFNDVLTGNSNANVLYGGDGNDQLIGGAGADLLDGGEGNDTADYSASSAAVNIDLRRAGAQSGGDAQGDILTEIESVIGSDHNDTVIGNDGTNYLYGMDGNDDVRAAYGNDTLDGGAGADTLWGARDTNLLLGGDGDDKLYGQGNNDTLAGGAGADLLDGGTEIDTADYSASNAWVNVDLSLATAQMGGGDGNHALGDTLTGIENLVGSNFGDVLIGNGDANVLSGLDGNDTITAGAGDTVDGGAGHDVLLSSDATLDIADSTSISGMERIDLTGRATSLTVSGDAILSNGVLDPLNSGMKALVVTGDAGDVVAFSGDTWAWQALPDSQTLSDGENYTVYEGTKGTDTVRLYVQAGVVVDSDVNDSPAVYLNAALHVNDTAAASLTGMLHASDPDNSAADLQYSIVSGPAYGELLLNGVAITDYTKAAFTQDDIDKGLVTFKFVPKAGTTAQLLMEDIFNFTVSDGVNTSSTHTFVARNDVVQVWGTDNTDGDDLTKEDIFDHEGAKFHVYGFDGNDILRGGVNADTLDGGSGVDTADYSASTAWVNVDLSLATAQIGGDGNHALGDTLTGIENLTGSDYDDVLTGDGGANVLNGLGGNDSLMGGDGDDILDGGDGNDTLDGDHGNNALYGGAGNDLLTVRLAYINERGFLDGGEGDDTLIGGHSADTLYGGDGDDFLYSGEFDWYWGEALYGGAGNDTLSTNNGDDFLSGGDGNDSLDGGIHCDTLYGGGGNDTLYGGTATTASWLHYPPSYSTDWDLLEGGAGNDILDGGAGADTLYGDDGNDSLYGGVSTPYQPVVAWDSADCDWLDGGAGDDTLDGGHSHDTLYGGVGKDSLMGGDGEDSLMGDDGNDVLMGGAGQDTLQGGAGDDLIHAGAEDSVDGGADNDVLVSEDAYLDVGPSTTITGIERIDLTGASEGLTVSGDAILRNGVADPADSEFMALVVTGDAGDWVARLADGGWTWDQAARDVLLPGDGNVYTLYEATKDGQTVRLYVESGLEVVDGTLHISGKGGPDDLTTAWDFDDPRYAFKVYGLGGNDTLAGGARADTLDGGAGVDTADYSASDAAVNIDLRRTGAQSGGDAKGDILIGIENVIGSDHNDIIIGSNGTNYLYGMDGNDDVRAAYGNDTLDGGAGNDTLWGARDTNLLLGGDADDKLYGQGGNDTLAGGAGADLLDGGTEIDTADYSASAAWVNVDLGLATAQMGGGGGNYALGDTLIGIENLTGSNLGDVLIGNNDANVLRGLDGADILDGGGGIDSLFGDAGDDILHLNLSTTGLLDSGETILPTHIGMLDGGDGTDTLVLGGHTGSGATLDLSSLVTAGKISGIERINITGDADDASTLTLKASDVFATSGGNSLYIEGNAGDTVTVTDEGWTASVDVTFEGQTYRHYVNQGYNLYIDAEIDQQNIIHS